MIGRLGEGGNGTVDLVRMDGEVIVMKTIKMAEAVNNLLDEVRIHKVLSGAGGAPLFRGLCLNPPRMFMTWAGESYVDYLKHCSDSEAVESLIIIGEKLTELHEKKIIHNDLKANNITVTVTTDVKIDFNIIDFGLSTRSGNILLVAADPNI